MQIVCWQHDAVCDLFLDAINIITSWLFSQTRISENSLVIWVWTPTVTLNEQMMIECNMNVRVDQWGVNLITFHLLMDANVPDNMEHTYKPQSRYQEQWKGEKNINYCTHLKISQVFITDCHHSAVFISNRKLCNLERGVTIINQQTPQ